MSLAHSQEDQLHSSDEEQPKERSHRSTLDRSSKRTRTETPTEQAPRKYVKGKRGSLRGIMTMPMEIFTEIAHYIHPGDLISLIRTSKFFRAMLLNQSAILIWQRALSNVPELPPCPTGLVEPQFSALMFSKTCTLCGAVATSRPDPFLLVRLCLFCREHELEEMSLGHHPDWPGGSFIPWTKHIKRTQKSTHKNPVHYLLAQRQEFYRMEYEFRRNDDNEGLAEWKLQQQKSWDTRCKEGKQLLKYFDVLAASRLQALKDLKLERRNQIYERLMVAGWEDKYFLFPTGTSNEKLWNSIIEVPKPLTERAWTSIFPKLNELLEENRPQIDEGHRQQRRHARTTRTMELLSQLKRDTHPYQSIIDALQLKSPATGIGSTHIKHGPSLPDPFPTARTILGWSPFVNLCGKENPLEQIDELFNERRESICQQIGAWRSQVEDQLVQQYKSSTSEGGSSTLETDTILTICGSTDATKSLSPNTRFLLRADTVFKVGKGGYIANIHFPDIPCITNDPGTYNKQSGFGVYQIPLDQYSRHAGLEAIIKALLRELNMADITYVEVQGMGKVFACGRCDRVGIMEWQQLVEHYRFKPGDWIGDKFVLNTYKAKHPVVFRNLHDLGPSWNSKPLARIVSNQGNNPPVLRSSKSVAECIICRGIDYYEDSSFNSLERMKEHMLEVHDSADPVEGLHFVKEPCRLDLIMQSEQFTQRNWEARWDKHHDTQNANNNPSGEPQSQPGPGEADSA